MSILSRLEAGNPVKAAAQQSTTGLTAMSPELIRWLSGASSSGKAVNEQTVAGISAAWCCRRILSESIGMLPWSMFKKEANGNAEKADDHPLQDVLVYSPNREQTSPEFRESETMGLTGDGNAYSVIERLGKRITSLYPIFDVEPMRKQGANTQLAIPEQDVFFRFNNRGKPEDLPREKIWQVKGFGRDPLRGLSPIGAAREAMGGALAMEDFANRFFSQGGMPAGTVSYPGWLTKEQREVARDSLQKMLGGLGKAHQFALFEGGVKPEPWNTMNLEEMQFIVARRFSVLEICRFYRVPPHMVAELEKGASFASIEQMSQEFVMFTLMPYITRFEASVSKWLLPAEERRKFFLRFNYEGLLRADSKGRADMYASAVQNGWMSRNQVRARENLNEADGLDDYTVQMNLTPVDRLGDLADATIKKGAQAAPAPAVARAEPSQVLVINQQPAPPQVTFGKGAISIENRAGDTSVSVPERAVNLEANITAPAAQVVVTAAPGVEIDVAAIAEAIRSAGFAVTNGLARPRQLVEDADGNPIGTVAVDKLEPANKKE